MAWRAAAARTAAIPKHSTTTSWICRRPGRLRGCKTADARRTDLAHSGEHLDSQMGNPQPAQSKSASRNALADARVKKRYFRSAGRDTETSGTSVPQHCSEQPAPLRPAVVALAQSDNPSFPSRLFVVPRLLTAVPPRLTSVLRSGRLIYAFSTHPSRPPSLVISFRTKALRTICEIRARAESTFGPGPAAVLRRRLADMRAAETVEDLLVGRPRNLSDGSDRMVIDLGAKHRLVFSANHPPSSDRRSLDWSTVRRVKILDIEVDNG